MRKTFSAVISKVDSHKLSMSFVRAFTEISKPWCLRFSWIKASAASSERKDTRGSCMTIFRLCVPNRKKAGQFEVNKENWCVVEAFIIARMNLKSLKVLTN